MADTITLKRIVDLVSQTDLDDGVYTVIDSVTGAVKKFPLGSMICSIAPMFSDTAEYEEGDFVNYGGQIYRFTEAHSFDEWIGTDAEAVTLTDVLATKVELSHKVDPDGTYENLTAGTAEQLLSDTYVEDSTPYTLRRSKSGSREYDEVVGGSIVYNQSVNSDSESVWRTSNATKTFADGVCTITATASGGNVYFLRSVKEGHVYYESIDIKLTTATTEVQINHYGGNPKINSVATTAWQKLECLYHSNGTASTRLVLQDKRTADWDAIQAKNGMIVDLTVMFGSAVAQHMADVWTQDAQAGCKLFRDMMGSGYLPYNSAGELMSVSGVSAHVMRDADDNIIGNYPLDSSLTLRGAPKVVNDNICYGGDIYSADGTVKRKTATITLDGSQSLAGNASGDSGYFSTIIGPLGSVVDGAIICDKYVTAFIGSSTTNVGIWIANSSARNRAVITIRPENVSGMTAAQFKEYLTSNPVTCIYELSAVDTTESALPYQHLQIVDAGGTEEYVTTGLVPVGHNTRYPTDLVAKLDGLPSDFSTLIAPTETGMTATRNYNTGEFLICNNILYKATASIATGASIVEGTNVVSTTIAEQLITLFNS